MLSLDRQMVQRTLLTFGLILLVVALSATLSQAARLTDDILEQGLNLMQFGLVLLTIVPKMAELVAPLAFGVAVVMICVQRNDSGTTLLLRAAGRGPGRDVGLVAGLSLLTSLGLLAVSGTLVPSSQIAYRSLYAQAEQDRINQATLPLNQPISIAPGQTLRVGAHVGDGAFRDIVLVDQSQPNETTIFRADEASLSAGLNEQGVLTLIGGDVQQLSPTGQQRSRVRFAQTTLTVDLPNRSHSSQTDTVARNVDTASTLALLNRWRTDRAAAEELTRRLAAGLSLLSFAVLAASVLLSPRPDSNSQTRRSVVLLVFLVVYLLLQSALISASGFGMRLAVTILGISAAPLLFAPFIQRLRLRAA